MGELEAARGKLQAKIVESEELVDVLTTKVANAEKSKTRMTSDLDDISMEYERVHAAALITEKRGKNFDKVLGEWQSKAADVSAEVAASQDEGRNYSSELFRLKAGTDEAVEQLDIVKRENKNLADEIKDLLDQLGEGGRSIHDLDKQRRRLEQEKEELQSPATSLHSPSSSSLLDVWFLAVSVIVTTFLYFHFQYISKSSFSRSPKAFASAFQKSLFLSPKFSFW